MIDLGPLEQEVPRNILARFRQWEGFLDRDVKFGPMGEGVHGREHCARVLLLSLMVSDGMGMDEGWTSALCLAAVFHDTRRLDDWYDVGHGDRGAEHYRETSERDGLVFDIRAYLAIKYHDRDDAEGEAAILESGAEDGVLLYRVLKDADALDRFRLGPDGLDPSFLRTPQARGLVDFARSLNRFRPHQPSNDDVKELRIAP